LPVARPNTVFKKVAYSSLAVFLAFAVAYIPLLLYLGYSYELHVVSTIVFIALGVVITLGLFGRGSEGFEDLGRTKTVIGVLIVVVLVEELLLNSVFTVYGLALSISGLVLLPIFAVVWCRGKSWLRMALESVALILGTRVVLSPFPLGFLNIALFLPTIYTLILVAVVLYLTYRRISARAVRISLGMRGVGFQMGIGLGVGLIIGSIEFLLLRPQPILVGVGIVKTLVYILIVMFMMVGVGEEILFRGLLQGSLERVMPVWQAIVVSSLMFGLMHIGWMNPLEVLLAFGAGVVFGYLATVFDSLIAPIMAHGFGNFILYLIVFYWQ